MASRGIEVGAPLFTPDRPPYSMGLADRAALDNLLQAGPRTFPHEFKPELPIEPSISKIGMFSTPRRSRA